MDWWKQSGKSREVCMSVWTCAAWLDLRGLLGTYWGMGSMRVILVISSSCFNGSFDKKMFPSTHATHSNLYCTGGLRIIAVWIPVLTVVGELHSLTDWQVSEASDDAELDDFYRNMERKTQHLVNWLRCTYNNLSSCEHCVCKSDIHLFSQDK